MSIPSESLDLRQLPLERVNPSEGGYVFADFLEKVLDRIDGPVLYKKGCALT